MSESEFLTPAELHQLTGYARPTSQAVWLVEHRVPHRVDGRRLIASRMHIRAWLEGRGAAISKGPNWSAVK